MRNDDVFLQLYLIRHAESMGNTETEEEYDVMNPPLTEHGQKQAALLAERMSAVKLDAVYTSPLERAICTALPIVQMTESNLRFDELLREKDVCIDFKGFVFKKDTDQECQLRAREFLNKLLTNHENEAVAVVSHGEFIQFLIREAMGISEISDFKFCVYNASVTKINFRKEKPDKLAFQNDISHLYSVDGDKTEWM